MFVGHVAERAEVKVMATGAFPAHTLNPLFLTGITDDVRVTYTCTQSVRKLSGVFFGQRTAISIP